MSRLLRFLRREPDPRPEGVELEEQKTEQKNVRLVPMAKEEDASLLHIDGEDQNKNDGDFYNSRSRVVHAAEDEKIVFFFDYSRDGSDEEIINWTHLKALKKAGKWGVIRHPMVLNFVNERLLDCAFFYTVHMVAYFSFLLLLSWHIFERTPVKDALVTAFLAVFFVFMVVKGAVKIRIAHSVSVWFVVAYTFNLLTYAATFLYVWLPIYFKYDNYHQEVKNIILWFLPIVAIISAWVNFLYILRKSPYGMYIFMMTRILRSFGHIATIWIPTLIAFSFAFHLLMRDTDIEPWKSVNTPNATMIHKLFGILQAITKTSTMMIGEVDANDILGAQQWIPSILVLVFEIITVILLMNLMVSLAVGDVSDLRNSAQDKILKIKVNFVIEALQLSERMPLPCLQMYRFTTNNELVVDIDGAYFTTRQDRKFRTPPKKSNSQTDFRNSGIIRENTPSMSTSFITALTAQGTNEKVYQIAFPSTRHRMRITTHPLVGRHRSVVFEGANLSLFESPESGIPELTNEPVDKLENPDGCMRNYAKWVIGLDWNSYLDL